MKTFLTLFFSALLFWALPGCFKQSSEPIDTGKLLPSSLLDAQLRGYLGKDIGIGGSFLPDSSYAVVNSRWLPGFYSRFRQDLFDKGVTGWDERFDCNKFAAAYCALAQSEYYRDRWRTKEAGSALAVGEVWYVPDRPRGFSAHAVALVITEQGAVFIEPQTGKELRLSRTELSSIFFRRF